MKKLLQKKRVVVANDILNYSPVRGHKHDIAETSTPYLQYIRKQLPQKKRVVVANDIQTKRKQKGMIQLILRVTTLVKSK